MLGIDHDYGPLPGVEAGVDALAAGDVAVDRGADAASPPADAGDEGFVFPADAGAATKLTLGDFHSCALFGGSGYAKCWGRGDDYGELGTGMFQSSGVPVDAMTPGLEDFFAGAHDTLRRALHARRVRGEGARRARRRDCRRRLSGAGRAEPRLPLAQPRSPLATRSRARRSGGVWCVGDGSLGELGNGALGVEAHAVQAQLGGPAKAVAAFYQHACALLMDGTVECWGDDSAGQIGNGKVTLVGVSTPSPVAGLASASAIGVGDTHSCALVGTGGGEVWCWGDNTYGELGDGTTKQQRRARPGSGRERRDHARGRRRARLRGEDYTVGFCWGHGASGELGNGSTSNQTSATRVSGIGGYPESLAAGGFHTCAMIAWPSVLCWGSNDFGQLGTGEGPTQQDKPVQVVW